MSTTTILMNLFKHVRQHYGHSTVKKIRDFENVENRIARHRNHLVFSLRCKDDGLIPPSLKLRSPINTNRAREIINKAQKQLLQERIRVISNKIDNFKGIREQRIADLETWLPSDINNKVKSLIAKSRETTFTSAKWRQTEKLKRLKEKSQGRNPVNKVHAGHKTDDVDLSGAQLKRWVLNLSKYKLNDAQTSLLAKGMNYAPTPQSLPVDDIIEATEKACLRFDKAESEQLRGEIIGTLRSVKIPPSNLTKEEQKALKDLKSEETIMILPSDKGRASVVMDKQDYENKIKIMLDDERTYEKLNKDPTKAYKSQLVRTLTRLKEENKINQKDYDYLYPTSDSIPRMYCTPKIHKPGTPLRPIVDYTSSIGYATSRSMADILAPIIGKTEYHVKNSQQLAEDLAEVYIEEDEIFNSHDVVSLFTNVPIDETLAIIKDRLEADNTLHQRTKLNVDDLMEILKFLCTTTYFVFRGQIYRQRFGTAMGSPVSAIIAEFCMEFLEQKAVATAPLNCRPKLWKRYVDDVLEIVKEGSVQQLTDHLNQTEPTGNIQFTHESEKDCQIPFLETLITRKPDGTVKLLIIQKTHPYRPIFELQFPPPPTTQAWRHQNTS